MSSDFEIEFITRWRQVLPDIPEPIAEYKFRLPRQSRFDFAFIDEKIGIELDGGTWIFGRHNRSSGMEADNEKLNAATLLGWRYLRFTRRQFQEDPIGCLVMIANLKGETPTVKESESSK